MSNSASKPKTIADSVAAVQQASSSSHLGASDDVHDALEEGEEEVPEIDNEVVCDQLNEDNGAHGNDDEDGKGNVQDEEEDFTCTRVSLCVHV